VAVVSSAMRFEMLSEPDKGHAGLMKGWRSKRMPGKRRGAPERR